MNRIMRLAAPSLAVLLLPGIAPARATPYGLSERKPPPAYLSMPNLAEGKLPALLSQTGVFTDLRSLKVREGILPYDLAVAFWSDGAQKTRFVSIPRGKVHFTVNEEWQFPPGTVFVKTFELPLDAANPDKKRRLETRILVRDARGGVYGVLYKWRADNSDADLLPSSTSEELHLKDANGNDRVQTWYYPRREDCLTCHTARAGGVLGLKTRQLNRPLAYPSKITDNELRTWNHLALFDPALKEDEIATLPALSAADDPTRSLEDRARSYLDANCSHCHRPGGTVANFDARYSTPLPSQGLIDGQVLIDEGIDHPRVVAPHDPWRSIMYMRVNTNDDIRMPPLARETIDLRGVKLLREWIASLPGREVLAPPTMTPDGGTFPSPVSVTLASDEAGAEIHYTLDGSAPAQSDPVYSTPIKLDAPTMLRARTFKNGFTRSISAQQLFIVGK